MPAVEPAVVGVAPLAGFANGDHDTPWTPSLATTGDAGNWQISVERRGTGCSISRPRLQCAAAPGGSEPWSALEVLVQELDEVVGLEEALGPRVVLGQDLLLLELIER